MPHKNKNFKKLVFFCLLIFATAGYFWSKSKQNQTSSSASTQAGKAMAKAMAKAMDVTTVTAKKESVQLFLELPGRVTSYKISEVRPQIGGVLRKIKFVEGSFVKAGQQLYQIDPAVHQEALNSANSNLKTLKAKRDRYKNLLEQDAVSKQEFDDISAIFAQAKSNAKTAQATLNYTKVLAPISGHIGKSNITEGTLLTGYQTDVLTTITQLDPIYVDMAQPSKDAVRIGNQNGVLVSVVTEDPTYKNTGKLKFSEQFADESTDSVRLRAIFSNKDQKLIPGMFVKAQMHLKPFEAVTVPQRATNRAPNGGLIIWIVDQENTARPRPIKAEQMFGDSWIVTEGLEEGETVIYEGFQKIADGMRVNPAPLVTREVN